MTELLIMGKRIAPERCPIVYDRPFTAQSLHEDWETRNSEWRCENDSLIGRNPDPTGGVIFSRRGSPGNLLLDFRAQTLPPSTHDIDVMFNMSWDDATGSRTGYVLGIQGWWEGKIGFEKAPENRLCAVAPCPWFRPQTEYHVQVGSIDGHCFVFVDGMLRMEMIDPDPIDAEKHNRFGFETYQSMVRIRDLIVRRIVWEPRTLQYAREF